MRIKQINVMNEDILADVDDGLNELAKAIQKKYNLSWAEAKEFTNHSLKFLVS